MSEARKQWISIKVDRSLMPAVDAVIEGSKRFGARRYRSRGEFAKAAFLDLLEKEHVNLSVSKRKKEEILVARK